MGDELNDSQRELVATARVARTHASAPYSNFLVGAAVRGSSGRVYGGCNVENASYGLAMCAERVAIFNAVSAGERQIVQLALCTDTPMPSIPCGACRQVLAEFADTAEVIVTTVEGKTAVHRSQDLLPTPFKLDGTNARQK
jgi:cytidine deaminase